MIRRIPGKGCGILLVEQNARAALSVADGAHIMVAGRITLEGKAADHHRERAVESAYPGAMLPE
ncbi:MAG: hypothetical protein PVF20_00620 [Desulfobacterales bacterium]